MTDGPKKKKNYGWLYYFIFLFVASVGVMAFMIWFNLSIQMTPEQLDAAMKTWEEKGPKSYDMIYTKRLNEEERAVRFAVKVRDRKVIEVLMDGKPLEKSADQAGDPRIYHSMTALYRDIETFQRHDAKPGAPKVYVTLKSREENGQLIEYIRRVMGSRQRVQIVVDKFEAK